MRNIDINKIKKSIGNGKVKILLGPFSNSMERFLLQDVFNEFQSSKKIFVINSDFPRDYLWKFLNDNIQDGSLFIVNRLSLFENSDAIINMFSGKKTTDLIASSNIDFTRSSELDSTKYRGRVQYIYFPPVLYDDFINSNESQLLDYLRILNLKTFDYISDYKYCSQAKIIYEEINKQIGYPVSLNSVFSSSGVDVSINTFISIFNYLNSHGFLYVINKIDVKKMDLVKNYSYCYPTDVTSIINSIDKGSDVMNKVVETFIVAKLIHENNLVYKAVYRNSDSDPYNPLLNTFLVISNEKRYFLKLYFKDNPASLERYEQYKALYPKYLLVTNKMDAGMDKNGITYMNALEFLKKGI